MTSPALFSAPMRESNKLSGKLPVQVMSDGKLRLTILVAWCYKGEMITALTLKFDDPPLAGPALRASWYLSNQYIIMDMKSLARQHQYITCNSETEVASAFWRSVLTKTHQGV